MKNNRKIVIYITIVLFKFTFEHLTNLKICVESLIFDDYKVKNEGKANWSWHVYFLWINKTTEEGR